jgi:tRNA 2-thiouridine synthesizing protein A
MGFFFFGNVKKMSLEVAAEIDARNTYCPIPVMRLAAQMKTLAIGDVVRVLATDPGFRPDVQVWCKGTRHTLESLVEENGVLVAEVRKMG